MVAAMIERGWLALPSAGLDAAEISALLLWRLAELRTFEQLPGFDTESSGASSASLGSSTATESRAGRVQTSLGWAGIEGVCTGTAGPPEGVLR
jgi:hypothetical protein